MPEGRIRYYDRERGFGRIWPDGASKRDRLHFHFSDVRPSAIDTLIEGGRVTFDLAPGKRGVKATNIESAERA
jgi:cold shock CspA family protein